MEDRALLIARNRAFEYGQSDALQQIPSRDTARQTFSSYPCSIDFGSTSAIEMPVDISFGPAAPSSRALPSNEDRRSPISPTSPLSSESLHLPGAPFPIRYQRSLRINTRGRGRKRNEGSWPENIGPVSEYDRPALGRSPSGKVPPAY
ncbi:hypothetical protein SISSUDRAFT_482009 [Sistotremastrum suecicum HHB10207 ss-3]|nr:hypothetical protein SISSUDRAFT_482009 [Sistotremastrum suecicum HHB10207 ss-3]